MAKSMNLGGGGRAAKLKAEGVPGPVIGAIARKKGVFGHNDFQKGPGKGTPPAGMGDPNGTKKGKDPYIKGAGPTKFSAKDCAMGDPNGKKPMKKTSKKNCY